MAIEQTNIPPQNLEAEESVLGAMMVSEKALEMVFQERLAEDDFYRERHRIEMHLASLKRQKVKVGGEAIDFRAGETIHTENSYKYSVESLAALARGVGWLPVKAWTDARKYFSIQAFTFVG